MWGATSILKIRSLTDKFQSTLPVWGATLAGAFAPAFFKISIHAPRVGSDVEIYARNPRGRLISIHAPRVGSDRRKGASRALILISIHAPRVGSDPRLGR